MVSSYKTARGTWAESIIVKQNDTKWIIDCVASNKHGADYYRFMLNLHESQYAMCTEYKDITGETRTVFHVTPNQVSAQNDGDMNAIHWHRFIDHVTSKPMQLPDSCQDPLTCGTQAPGWLRGGHPSPEDYAVLAHCVLQLEWQLLLCRSAGSCQTLLWILCIQATTDNFWSESQILHRKLRHRAQS
ncbi:proteinric peroxidase [Desmophyllum pertusum]|uniref:Proteinric peroxidase n=1 Tax=Desmophyllum pertusum TaxID=174260 RepID=A0A9W9ZZ35_9CNID|nr:proteinric peroxidase [Desmophyllum pertusum]